ncbi:MAG: outer membrane protein assembly factor BamC [Burkholderiales bacterium]|nr:outer membrane protein assembly factor BamC [Burkholderiales bacterium]
MKRLLPLAIVIAPLVLASGCGIFKTEEQQRAARTRERPLEMPPDLTTPTADDRFAIPDPRATTSYSQYNRDRTAPAGTPVAAAASGVLPAVPNARIERAGDQRWILAKAEPGQVWPVVREFWQDLGFTLARETPEAGILETNWRDTRAAVEQAGFRGVLSKWLPGMYSTGERDRFRTRIERGVEPGTVEIYVSHRGLEEVFTSTTTETTKWVPRGTGTDRDLEAEMLGRLLVKLGEPTKPATLAAAPGKPGTPSVVDSKAAPVAVNAVLQNNGAGPLVVNDGFDRAWRRVGLALDRSGFTVEDRDRSKGVFFVRYIDPDAQDSSGKGWMDSLAFWRPAEKTPQPQYRVLITGKGESQSEVVVQNAKGEVETSATGKRILALLLEQLK